MVSRIGFTTWLTVLVSGVRLLAAPQATPADAVQVLPGFKLELLYSFNKGEEGSIVAMAVDKQGRLILAPQGERPPNDKQRLLRVTLKEGKVGNIESIDQPIWGAMGLLYALDSLYVNGRGPDGYHLYRLRDTDGQGHFGAPELLRRWNGNKGGNGEHGAHGIVLGPDGKLYVVCGNFVDVPSDISSTSPHRNFADDQLLPRMEDGNGFGAGRKPPGGFIVRMDPDGKNAELFASGERNTYDIAFNPEGELFGFDSDMEWDWGAPWYRPIRAFHAISGADHGFREGSAKWPEYYQDSLPPVVNIGIGSPTGVKFGTGAKFPHKYQDAFYMMDWSYGRIVAVHLKPSGSSYVGTWENLVHGKLNVTDMEIGPDGALYFTTGGRSTQSGLYRVSYTQNISAEDRPSDTAGAEARKLRHALEQFDGKQDPRAVAMTWLPLGSEDRVLRYAARIALESQPVSEWKEKALTERDPLRGLTALMALARVGGKETQPELLGALKQYPMSSLNHEQQLLKLRVIEISFIRQGRPNDDFIKLAIDKLSPLYPAASWPLNRELSQILIYLDAPGTVQKTLALMAKAETQEEQLHYMVALRNAKSGWNIENRRQYLSWFQATPAHKTAHPQEFEQWFADVGIRAGNGSSYNNFLKNLRKDITGRLNPDEQAQLAFLLTEKPAAIKNLTQDRKFVREWRLSDFADEIAKPSHPRNYARGKQIFTVAQCVQCHKLGDEGGAVGPDLAGAGAKYTRRDLLESILEPSKVVSDQYQNIVITTKDDEDTVGRLVEETDKKVVLVINPLTGDKIDIRKGSIKARTASKVSPMPEGLANILTREEILDLVAYLESGGRKEHAVYAAQR